MLGFVGILLLSPLHTPSLAQLPRRVLVRNFPTPALELWPRSRLQHTSRPRRNAPPPLRWCARMASRSTGCWAAQGIIRVCRSPLHPYPSSSIHPGCSVRGVIARRVGRRWWWGSRRRRWRRAVRSMYMFFFSFMKVSNGEISWEHEHTCSQRDGRIYTPC